MARDRKQQRDAATLGDAQRPESTGERDADAPNKSDRMEHAEIRENIPGERDDLNADNSQGFTGEIGDRDRQVPGSEATRRTVPRDDAGSTREPTESRQRDDAAMNSDDFENEDTVD
ncbi:MAG: hypothetical protein WEB52_01780 [Dehalococcoidia bacterium]